VVYEGDGFKVKELFVNPESRLSLQKHRHRSEHWTVVSGVATVTINETESDIDENNSVFIPQGAIHRLENKTKSPVTVIEVQYGTYLGEDDIHRIEDDYLRNTH
jgi:mannose-6-phosphate isomerase-like protein (cupin superfamily)